MKKIISLILVLILVVGCIPLGSMAESGETTAGESTGPGSDTGGAGTESGANTGDSGAGTDTGDTNTGDTGSGGDLGTDTGDTGTGDTGSGGSEPSAPTDWDATHFSVSVDGATVLGFTEAGLQMLSTKKGNLEFPENLNATIIGVSAFQENTDIISVTMNSKITTIGDRAFYGDSNLTALTMGDVLSSIGESAFEDCSINHAITIEGSGTNPFYRLGDCAFKNNRIPSVQLKGKIGTNKNDVDRSVGKYVFQGNLIQEVRLDSVVDIQGLLDERGAGRGRTHNGVYVPWGMFRDNRIHTFHFPEGKNTFIGQEAFENNAFETLVVPSTQRNFFNYSFRNNANLHTVIFEGADNTVQLDKGTFLNCNISTVENFEAVYEMGHVVWAKNNFSTIVLPDINTVGTMQFVFNKDKSISKVVLNNIVYSVEGSTFSGLPIKNVDFSNFRTIPTLTFDISKMFYGAKLRSVEFPSIIMLDDMDGSKKREIFSENRGWYEGTDLVALYRKDFASGKYVLDNNVTDSAANGYIVNPVLLEFLFVDDSGNEIGSAPNAAVTIKRKKGGTLLPDQTVDVTGEDYLNFKLGDEISFGIPAVSGYTFKEAVGNSTLVNVGEGDVLRYSVTLNPDQVTNVSYDDGYEVGYKKFVVTLKYQSAAAPQGTNASEEETTEATTPLTEATTPKTEVTSPTTEATASAPDTTVSAENTTAAQATSPQEEATTAASITTDSIAQVTSAAVITTTPPVTTIARRDFDFVDISELIPLGVTTLTEEDTPLGINTAPLDLELLLSSEDIPLAGIIVDSPNYLAANELPYTGFLPNEIFIGLGMIVAALGIAIKKKGA